MPRQTIALLALAVVGGSGFFLALLSLLLKRRAREEAKRCSGVTEGTVTRYVFPGKDRMAPVIAFEVHGETYLCQKRPRGYKIVRTSLPQKAEAWEDEQGYVHVKGGPLVDLKELAQQLWPQGSQVLVHYDPQNPKLSYAGSADASSRLPFLLLAAGVGLLVLAGLLYWLILP